MIGCLADIRLRVCPFSSSIYLRLTRRLTSWYCIARYYHGHSSYVTAGWQMSQIHRVPKKEATKLLPIGPTFSNLNRFSKKEFWKSVKIWKSYWQKFGGFLFGGHGVELWPYTRSRGLRAWVVQKHRIRVTNYNVIGTGWICCSNDTATL